MALKRSMKKAEYIYTFQEEEKRRVCQKRAPASITFSL